MSVRKEQNRRGNVQIVCDRTWPDGKRFRRLMPNRTIAKQTHARIAAAIATGTWHELRKEFECGRNSDMSVAEFADHYLEAYCKPRNRSWRRKHSSLKHINRLLGRHRLGAVEIRHVHIFVARRLKEEVKAATVNRDVTILKHMFEFAVDEGVLNHNPIARVKKLKEYREERRRVTGKDLEHILKHLLFPVKQIVLFISETGCRPSEALSLKWQHVDVGNKTAIFNIRKAGDNALVALTSRAVAAVQYVPPYPDCPYVFWNPKTGTRYQTINETFSRARAKAGLPWVQLKDFRRELGILIAESGQPLHVAQWPRHSSDTLPSARRSATMRTSHLSLRSREPERSWSKDGGKVEDKTRNQTLVKTPSKTAPVTSLIFNDLEGEMEAATGLEPVNGGFADLSLSHLGTPPLGAIIDKSHS